MIIKVCSKPTKFCISQQDRKYSHTTVQDDIS